MVHHEHARSIARSIHRSIFPNRRTVYGIWATWEPTVPTGNHRDFYNSQRFTLNLTRADMIAAGYSPSVRLFEAAACATPIISDYWNGLETFFTPGKEILVASTSTDVVSYLSE